MGERAAGGAVPLVEKAAPLPRAPMLALVLGLVALLGVAVAPRPALDGEGARALLLAQSLARDGDRLWQLEDRARAEALAAADELLPGVPTRQAAYGEPIAGPVAYGLLLAPWAALAGARGALLAQGLLLAGAALFAAVTLFRHIGREAAWLPALLVLASTAGACTMRLWPEAALAAALLVAFSLARRAHPPLPTALGDGAMPELYPEEPAPARSRLGSGFAWRWLAVGALLGAVASAAPWTLPLLWPAAAAVPPSRRRAGGALVLGAAAVVLLGVALVAAATAGAPASPRALLAGIGWSLPSGGLHPAVLAWDLAYLVAGRHLGLLFYGAPLLLLAAVGGRGQGRGALWGGAALSLLLLLLLRPFDLAGGALTLGPRALVPLAAALCLAPVRSPARWALLLTTAWAAVWLWPLWLAPRQPFGPEGELRYAAPYLAPWSPLETTQPSLRFGAPLRLGSATGGKAILLGGEVLGGGSVAAVPAGRWVELLTGIPEGAPGFWVEAGEQAGNELGVRGAEVTETIFRPDGGIAFLVRPRRAAARHAMPGSAKPWSFYHVSLRLPGRPGARLTIRMRAG
jgi:hypothetical protein